MMPHGSSKASCERLSKLISRRTEQDSFFFPYTSEFNFSGIISNDDS